MSNKKELSIYVHIPYCQRKCRYCDFVSFENEYDTVNQYINVIVNEISQYNLSDYVVKTIFFGGGTPSSIPSDGIERILYALREKYIVSDDVEITVECNPCSLN